MNEMPQKLFIIFTIICISLWPMTILRYYLRVSPPPKHPSPPQSIRGFSLYLINDIIVPGKIKIIKAVVQREKMDFLNYSCRFARCRPF